ncbi:uncharacterized protein Triagg1_6987 [Trichoderma aggressivum f. europaeum]|uniref:Dienelactone hydrolase domain-containing protein n=1 Tax=Trichoderma aggressivum f. europaeum TaxID=173218 RepID=A0AAE1IED8_9HYPO|nr:hypothetical protein Triagg1_6987 [Trichoderma aggressivum f. europaeum]
MSQTIKTVSIPNIAWATAADIQFPPNFDNNKKYPAVVSAHPIGLCKEQTSGNIYGKALAEAGFVVFRVSDFRFVVDYIQTLPHVDADRIGVLGICGGGGYAINATMTVHRLKCCVGITPVNFGRLSREAFSNYDPVDALEKMAKQRTIEAQGRERLVINLLPPSASHDEFVSNDVTPAAYHF